MTSVALQRSTIRTFLGIGDDHFNPCKDITAYHVDFDVDSDEAQVSARIPSSTTGQSEYAIKLRLQSDGSEILNATCTCPVGGSRCKHIHKVLCRVADLAARNTTTVRGPDHEVQAAPQAKRRRVAEKSKQPSVYVAFRGTADLDNDRWDDDVKLYEEEVLGVFFSKARANECAREYVRVHILDDEGDDDLDEDDDECFAYNEAHNDDFANNTYDKIWVSRHFIEDASPRFQK